MAKNKLLIIDDDPDVAARFNEALKVNGFTGDIVNDAIVGLSTFRNNVDAYFAVICDIRMPGKSGIELSKEIKKINPSIHLILMSDNEKDYYSHANSESIMNFSDQFAIKPKNAEQVIKLISGILEYD
ncbi:MAG TPA: response regulator [Nitrososphaeraceae archaeon]